MKGAEKRLSYFVTDKHLSLALIKCIFSVNPLICGKIYFQIILKIQ